MRKFGVSEGESVALFDDDNDLPMAMRCGSHYLPGLTSDSVRGAAMEHPAWVVPPNEVIWLSNNAASSLPRLSSPSASLPSLTFSDTLFRIKLSTLAGHRSLCHRVVPRASAGGGARRRRRCRRSWRGERGGVCRAVRLANLRVILGTCRLVLHFWLGHFGLFWGRLATTT